MARTKRPPKQHQDVAAVEKVPKVKPYSVPSLAVRISEWQRKKDAWEADHPNQVYQVKKPVKKLRRSKAGSKF